MAFKETHVEEKTSSTEMQVGIVKSENWFEMFTWAAEDGTLREGGKGSCQRRHCGDRFSENWIYVNYQSV